MGVAVAWTTVDVLEDDVLGDVFVGISGFRFLGGIKVGAVGATRVPSVSVD